MLRLVLFLYKRSFDHVLTQLATAGFLEAPVVEDLGGVFEHGRATTQHEAVVFQAWFGQAQVLENLAAGHQVGEATFVAERLSSDGGVIEQFAVNELTEELVVWQLVFNGCLLYTSPSPRD